MSYLPLIIIAIALFGVMSFGRRNRQRAALQQQEQLQRISFGTDVMTTSGLYGTVVGINDDETIQLAIAPGVEVKWALAAVRDVATLPKQPAAQPVTEDESPESGGAGESPNS